jgi:hypothetical protein
MTLPNIVILIWPGNPLTSLEGAPKYIRSLSLSETTLSSLEYCPQVQRTLLIQDCKQLKSLKGLPDKQDMEIYADNSRFNII